MAIEIKQHLKLSQQLVMTPQLQQAIKLLQLSRMELVDLVREEMMENPVLEDGADEQRAPEETGVRESNGAESIGETELAPPDGKEREQAGEVKADSGAVSEIDWDNYLENYTMAPASPVYRSNSEELPSIESTLTKKASLCDHLAWQLKLSSLAPEEERLGLLIIGNLDNDGYLRDVTLEELAQEANLSVERAQGLLARIQEFDPVGVAARSLGECLLIQARYVGADDEIVVAVIERHLGNLEKKNYPAIAKDLGQPLEEIIETAKLIAGLNPKPGREYLDEEPHYITPDVYVYKVGDKYFVVPNDDGLPKLKISSFYKTALAGNGQARQYVQDKLRSAQWLIRSIQQRQRTIVKATESIIKFQRDFFDKGIAYLRPLILRDVAEDISMHESTISRVTTNKYVHTPQGIFELKYFFNSGISRTMGEDIASESVKSKIKEIVSKEDQRHPMSDQRLVELLRDQSIDIARRTVAKYREQLGILSSSKRRRLF